LKKGCRLDSHDQIDEQYSLLLSEKLSKKIAVCYHIDCTKDVLHQLFFLFFNRRYAWSANDLQKKAEHDEAIAKVRRTLLAFFAKIEKSEQLVLINKDELLLLLYNATSYTWTSAKILHNPSEDFFVNLNHYHEGFARRIKKELVACLNREQLDIYLDDSVINQLLFMLVTAWKGLMDQLEASAPRVKAGIFFNTSFEHSQFLLNDISYHLKSRLDMTLITAKTISELRQQCQHVDMLITNLSMLPSPDCHIVSIQANLTPKDFENILSVYSEIVNANVTAS
ncbi:MAG: transcriptional antiterminator, partial [Lacticaseibacillus paracasei]